MSSRRPDNVSLSVEDITKDFRKKIKSIYNNGVSLSIPNPIYGMKMRQYFQNRFGIYYKMKNRDNHEKSWFSRIRSASMTISFAVPSYNINKSKIRSIYKNYETRFFKQISKDYDFCNQQMNQHFGKYNIANPFSNIIHSNGKNRHLLELELGWNLDYFF